MSAPNNNTPTWESRGAGESAGRAGLQPNPNPTDALLQRLERVTRSGCGHRADCPSCGKRGVLSVTEADTGAVLMHCFVGCPAADVLAAIDLRLHDLFPVRLQPVTAAEHREAHRRMKEAGWAAALGVLAIEASVACAAASQLLRGEPLSVGDHDRLALAVERIAGAQSVLT